MQLVKKLISDNFEKYEHFDQYNRAQIDTALLTLDKNPDITIECCKALIEGVCKSVLKKLDQAYNHDNIKDMDYPQLCRKALNTLAEYDESFHADLTHRTCAVITTLGDIRNERGDICHGKHAPKDIESNKNLAQFVLCLTEGIVFYILDCLFPIETAYDQELLYDDNKNFNEYLDEAYPLEGKPLYSRALFDQYPLDYELQLEQYKLDQENEEETEEE